MPSRIGGSTLVVAAPLAPGAATLLIRPEAVALGGDGPNVVEGEVREVVFLGGEGESRPTLAPGGVFDVEPVQQPVQHRREH